MKNNFQTILIIIFIAGGVLAVLIFSGVIKVGSSSKNEVSGKVTIWGTLDKTAMTNVLDTLTGNTNGDLTVSYIQKNKETYQTDLIEAFAKDKTPDLFIITEDMIIENKPYITVIPFSSFAEKDFNNTFIDGADIYKNSKGILAFPLLIDPMVMYYNKNLLSNEGIVNPPSYWDELFTLNDRLTKKLNNNSITESMIALGEFDNVNNAKDIIMTLMQQSGNSVIEKADKSYVANMNNNPLSLKETPVESVLNFYIQFSNPSLSSYSWNKVMPNSFDLFIGDKLAFYLGHASELFKIEKTNPNLSFDIKMIPQARGVPYKRTGANIYAIALSKKSTNPSVALYVAQSLSYGASASDLSKETSLPPAVRSLLSNKPSVPYLDTFFNSAIISRAWIDPNDKKTDKIFKELLSNISSNTLSFSDAIRKANDQLDQLINNI